MGIRFTTEHRLICKDGSGQVGLHQGAAVHRSRTGEQYFYCVFVDITEEKQLQERMRELYEKELAYFAELAARARAASRDASMSPRTGWRAIFPRSDVAVAQRGGLL